MDIRALWPPLQYGHPCNMATRAIWPPVPESRINGAAMIGPSRIVETLAGLQDAETRENYYKINDIVHKLAKNRVGVSSSVSAGVISVSTGVRSALGGVYHTVAQSILPVTASADGTAAQSEQEEAIRQLQHIMNDME